MSPLLPTRHNKMVIRDVLEVRCALEELAVQLACDRMDEEGVRELRAAAETFESI